MRGKASNCRLVSSSIRITPAYAGKSGVLSGVLYAFEDHPRLCGEKKCPLVRAYSILGSPPPMRGKDLYHVRQRLSAKDHPRLCGEKAVSAPIFFAKAGSPPPMRGKVI